MTPREHRLGRGRPAPTGYVFRGIVTTDAFMIRLRA
jgi:hypothetical protein